MQNKYHWITPLFAAILVIGSIWFITDLEANVYFWKISYTAILGRLYAMISVIVLSYIFYIISRKVINHHTKNNKKILAKEFIIILLITILIVTIGTLFTTYFINKDNFTWANLIRNYGLVVPIFCIYYIIMRNSRMTEEYNRQTLLLEKMKNKQLETELNFLKSQYHPHFLFNALNTIYFQVDDENKNAKQTIEILSNLLRYQLYDINQKVPIQKEIDYLKTYILLLQMRASERLVVESNFDLLLKEQEIHPLLFQPLLENAFKYIGGKYFIHINLTLEGNKVVFTVKNSVNTTLQNMKTRKGIGIENLKRRLEILYPEKHSLKTELKENIFLAALVIML